MNGQALKILESIRLALIERREEGALVSPMQALLDECVCQETPEEDLKTERKGRMIVPGTKSQRRDGVYVKQSDGRWLKMKAKKKGPKDAYAGMSMSQINRQRSKENRG